MPLDDHPIQSPEERQRFPRRSILVAALLKVSGELFDVDILDLSEGGAKLTAPAPFNLGVRAELIIEGIGEFPAKVVWRDGGCLGLQFVDSPASIADEIPKIIDSASDERERRQHVRSSVLWKAELFNGIRRAECDVLNISDGGARLRMKTAFSANGEVTIRSIHFGERKGMVIWQDKDRIGIKFNDS